MRIGLAFLPFIHCSPPYIPLTSDPDPISARPAQAVDPPRARARCGTNRTTLGNGVQRGRRRSIRRVAPGTSTVALTTAWSGVQSTWGPCLDREMPLVPLPVRRETFPVSRKSMASTTALFPEPFGPHTTRFLPRGARVRLRMPLTFCMSRVCIFAWPPFLSHAPRWPGFPWLLRRSPQLLRREASGLPLA